MSTDRNIELRVEEAGEMSPEQVERALESVAEMLVKNHQRSVVGDKGEQPDA